MGDICNIPISEKWFLIRLGHQSKDVLFEWSPLANDENNGQHFWKMVEEHGVDSSPLSRETDLATMLLLKPELAL